MSDVAPGCPGFAVEARRSVLGVPGVPAFV